MRKVKFADVLKQYKIYHFVDDNTEYRQVTISRHTGVSYRGTKFGRDIGRKRQFVIDLEEYPNTFIFTRQGVQDGSYGIVPQDVHNCVVTENMPMFAVQPTLNPAYLEFYLQTKHFQDQLQALNAAGSAQKSIHEKTLLQLDILLPDIGVQNAIVEEIESVKVKQGKVLTELKTQSNLIIKLRSSILSDAVSGRLVPQDPTDESASMLLEQIKAEKERLIKEGKLKRDKPLLPITADESPYELPVGWVWCRLGDIITNMDSGWSPACLEQPSDDHTWGVLKTTAVQDLCYLAHENKTLPITLQARPQYEVQRGDILITRAGPKNRVGICCLVNKTPPKLMISDKIIRFHLYPQIYPAFIELSLNCGASNEFIETKKSGMAESQVNISQGNLKLTPVPLPPLSEQHRIVTKVEKLMNTCNGLEAEVAKSRVETDRLMQTILKEAFENDKL